MIPEGSKSASKPAKKSMSTPPLASVPHIIPSPDGSKLAPENESLLRRSRSMTTRTGALGYVGGNGFAQPTHRSTPETSSPTNNPPTTTPQIETATSSTALAVEYIVRSPTSSPVKQDVSSPGKSSVVSPGDSLTTAQASAAAAARLRRSSHDEKTSGERYFLIDVAETERIILEQEDTDGDFQITVNDIGPKSMKLGSAGSSGFRKYDLRGTYVLSNLLQELALAKDVGRQFLVVPESKLNENPVTRLSRMIATHFWSGLTRAIDRKGMQLICNDPKNRSHDQSYKIYVPYHDFIAREYYANVMASTSWGLQMHVLPPDITPEYVKTLDEHPGILSLALHKVYDPLVNAEIWRGVPFLVPGGRFNEMYGWDSYFETLGLLQDNRPELGRHMVDNFCYQIHYYGKILNANRTYYLTRSQPPFLTDMALAVFNHTSKSSSVPTGMSVPSIKQPHPITGDREWLLRVLLFAIKEYYTVWMAAPRLDLATGLSAYHPTGIGMPPETEATHFLHILEKYAKERNMDVNVFSRKYNMGAIKCPELDRYFIHDRAVRESGHDTTYRLERRCADLLTVDLNALLYKYEVDIAHIIDLLGMDSAVPVPDQWYASSGLRDLARDPEFQAFEPVIGTTLAEASVPTHLFVADTDHTSVPVPLNANQKCHWERADVWKQRAARRQRTMTECLWNEKDGLFYDFDIAQQAQSNYKSVTTLWVMWAGAATPEQARITVERALPLFEVQGGLVSGTEESRGSISLDRPNRQWDYPFGWAPHQMMAWRGLEQYGYTKEAKRLAYRWLYTITKAFVDFNGTVPEKFDVVTLNHLLKVEYGNVGTDFKYVPREGFGWMNASYQVGLSYLDSGIKRKLGVVSPPSVVFGSSASFSGQHPRELPKKAAST